MVLKGTFAAALCTGFLMAGGPAMADEYRPSEFLGLDLSRAVLSPKRLGPETEFAPVPIEAKTEDAPAHVATVAKPKNAARKTHVARHPVRRQRAAARARLVRRHSNPLDAQARDTRIQTWPCRSGGICNWPR